MHLPIDSFLAQPDTIVLKNLFQDIDGGESYDDDQKAMNLLAALNDKTSDVFEPTVFTGWDIHLKDSNGTQVIDSENVTV